MAAKFLWKFKWSQHQKTTHSTQRPSWCKATLCFRRSMSHSWISSLKQSTMRLTFLLHRNRHRSSLQIKSMPSSLAKRAATNGLCRSQTWRLSTIHSMRFITTQQIMPQRWNQWWSIPLIDPILVTEMPRANKICCSAQGKTQPSLKAWLIKLTALNLAWTLRYQPILQSCNEQGQAKCPQICWRGQQNTKLTTTWSFSVN